MKVGCGVDILKHSMKRLLGVISMLSVCCAGYAQEVTYSSDSTKAPVAVQAPPVVAARPMPKIRVKPILHEISFGFRANTNGWSIYSDYGKAKTSDARKADMFYNLLYLQTEFTEKKDPKEQKVKAQTLSDKSSASYIYGKINNFYALKLGLGYRKMLAGKPDPGCVSIHWANTAGFALGMLKPYYIQVAGSTNEIKYSDINQSDFLNQAIISGAGGFSKGLGEIVFIPGGHIRSALHFDFSANRKNVLGVEAGVNAEFYSQPIGLMANEKTVSSFLDFFVAFQLGKRW